MHGTALIALSSLLFAGMAVLARVASGRISTGQLVVIRFAIGLLGVGAVFALRRQGPRIPRPGLWALRGLFGGGAVYCYFLAIDRVGVGPATLMNYAAPCYAALFAVLFLRERPNVHLVSGLVAATLGAALVAVSTADPSRPFSLNVGAWAGILSAVLSGAAMTTVRGLRSDTDAPTVLFSFCLFGALIGLPEAIARWQPLSADLAWPALGVGVLSFAAQMLFTYAFAFVTAASGSATTQLTPVISWALGTTLLGEAVRPLSVLGALVCMGGVFWGAVAGWRSQQRAMQR